MSSRGRFGILGIVVVGVVVFSGKFLAEADPGDGRTGIIQEIADGLNEDVWTNNLNGPDTAVETVAGFDHPVRFGESSIRGFIGEGSDNYRAEYNAHRVLPENEYWYGWSLFLPDDLPLDEDHWGTIVTQFKFWPRTGIDEASLPGGGLGTHLWLASSTRGDAIGHRSTPTIRLVHHWEALDSDVDGERDIQLKRFLVSVDPKLGVWHDFVMNVRWTEKGDGFLKLWHQEDDLGYALVVDRSGPTMWKNQPRDQGPYFSAGPYAGGSAAARTIYSDAYRLGDSTSNFNDVRPDPDGAPPRN